MKIEKFNEAKSEKLHVCMIIADSQVEDCGIFNNEDDMDIWLLNIINNELFNFHKENGEEGVDISEELFDKSQVIDAINWYHEIYDCNIYYNSKVNHFKNVKLKYSKYLDARKYNI